MMGASVAQLPDLGRDGAWMCCCGPPTRVQTDTAMQTIFGYRRTIPRHDRVCAASQYTRGYGGGRPEENQLQRATSDRQHAASPPLPA